MKASAVVVSVTFLFIAVLAGGYMWLLSTNEDMMFVPRPNDTRFVRDELAPVFGEAAETIEVIRVDRDVSAYFFVIKKRDDLIAEATKRLVDQGWGIVSGPEVSKDNPAGRLTASRSISGPKITIVTITLLNDGSFYGACAMYDSEHFWKRYEENEKYLEKP